MSTDTVEKSLEDKIDDVLKAIEESDEKSLAGHRDHGNGISTIAFWEREEAASGIEASKLKSLHARDMVRMDALRQGGYKEQFRSFGEFIKGVYHQAKHPGSALAKSFDAQVGEYRSQMKAVGLNTYEADAAGILVPPEYSSTLIDRDHQNDLWGRTRGFTVSGDNMTFPVVEQTDRTKGNRTGGLQAFWRGEEQEYEESRPKVRSVRLQLKKLTVLVYVSEELLDDNAFALEQWINGSVHSEFNFVLGEVTKRGDGANQPLGYLNSPVTHVVSKESGQGAGTIEPMNILNMWKSRLAGTRPDWFVNQEVESELYSMVLDPTATGAGALVFTPPGGLSGAPYATLMGRPVTATEFNSAVGTEGDITLSDYSHMLSIAKGGISEASSTHVAFDRDQTALKFSRRVDCRPQDDKPTTPAYGSNGYKQSAFVALETRA